MTAEKLHDALTLLPADLIAGVDKKRSRRPKVIQWKRWAAMAACLALMVYGGWLFQSNFLMGGSSMESAKESPAEWEAAAAPAAQAPASEEGMANGSGSSQITAETQAAAAYDQAERATADAPAAMESPDAWSFVTPRKLNTTASYTSDPRITLIRSRAELDEYFTYYDYQYDFSTLPENCGHYDEAWFENHDLLLLAIHTVPTDQDCMITSVTEYDGCWEIGISNYLSIDPPADRTDWHLLLGVEKDQIPSKESVTLIFE